MDLSTLIILISVLPLAAAVVTALLGPRLLRGASHVPSIIAIAAAFVCSVVLLTEVRSAAQREECETSVGFEHVCPGLWTWARLPDVYTQQPLPPALCGGSTGWGLHDFTIDIVLRVDALTAIMLAMVTFVSLCVVIFSAGYMKGDRGYWRFFSYVSLFVFSMSMLVSVSNLLLLFIFWEAVGVCSYFLIGFWYEKPEAAAAGKKAFLVNRVGDFGFALALLLIWSTYGTLNMHDTDAVESPTMNSSSAEEQARGSRGILGQTRLKENDFVGGPLGLTICLLLLLGACGKSAQFPLHVWLPDAMEGPTPVSALIHAATMVTAGIYMTVRFAPLFMVSPEALLVIAVIGGFTALFAGLIALTQTDLKRVLAYSTVSQLGYMFLAVGTGTLAGIAAGMFHLFTHAFFKALLFLAAGSVMHAMGGVIDIRRFGGLRKLMPITHITFLIGCLALAGIWPFAGFWSKDAILGALHDKIHSLEQETVGDGTHQKDHAFADPKNFERWGFSSQTARGRPSLTFPVAIWLNEHAATGQASFDQGLASLTSIANEQDPREHDNNSERAIHARVYRILYYSAVFTAFLTAFYTARVFFRTFYGPLHIPHEAGDHAHESPLSMCGPLGMLAVCASVVGVALHWSWQHGVNTNYFADFLELTPSLASNTVQSTIKPGYFHTNIAIVSTVVAVVGIGISASLYLGHRRKIDWLKTAFSRLGLYQLSLQNFFVDELYSWIIVWPLRNLATFSYFIDRWVVDGLVNLCGRVPVALGGLMRGLQMGLVPFYALAMMIGLLVLIAARLVWASL